MYLHNILIISSILVSILLWLCFFFCTVVSYSMFGIAAIFDCFNGGDVGEAEAGEAKSCRAAPGPELHGPSSREAGHVGKGEGRVADAALDELDEDQGRGPHRGAHLEGVVVLLEHQHRAADRKLHHRRRCEPHLRRRPVKTLKQSDQKRQPTANPRYTCTGSTEPTPMASI
jgi:hypothetical protein